MKRYASPHRPGDDNLRRTIERTARRNARREARTKGQRMNWKLRATAVSAFIGVTIAGIALVDASDPSQTWNGVDPCYRTIEQVLICTGPTPDTIWPVLDASVSTLTPREVVDTPTNEIETVRTLPFTGTGSTST